MDDLLSLLGEEGAPPQEEAPAPSRPPSRRKKAAAAGGRAPHGPATAKGEIALDAPDGPGASLSGPDSSDAAPPGRMDPEAALPALDGPQAVRQRAIDVLSPIDPSAAEQVAPAVPFPPEDDPFVRTAVEWEAAWYVARESAWRVYLNMRVEFRQQLARAAAGEPHDLKPWTFWVFGAARPEEGEPVYGLTAERRAELGWDYPGPATDFRIYRELPADAG